MNYTDKPEEELLRLRRLYEGHEISCHTLRHGWPARMPMQAVVKEVTEDRMILEKIAEYPVIGMSYPSGSYSDEVCEAIAACGIVYSRTTVANMNFALPENFLKWHPTCHHKEALALCDSFLENIDSQWTHPLFYIWGHSHELNTEEDWSYMEELVKRLSGNDKIWYATNIDIYNYMQAQKQLQISYDETVFYNPTAIDVWVEKDKKDIICIPAGKRIKI